MNRRLLLIIAVLFFVAWFPRVLGLDRFVTPDERKWLARSANFYQAVSQGDLANTFQREHPGVTVMWAGTLGFLQRFPSYAQSAPGQFAWDLEHIEAWLLHNTSHTPLEMLVAGRWWVVLAISLALTLSYFPLRRLLGEKVALLALLIVLWDPFHIALSRQLHPDGLTASLSFLALTTFLAWLYGGQQRRYLIGSGIVMGLAWLTKSPTILLAPIAGLLVGFEWLSNRRDGDAERRARRELTSLAPSPPVPELPSTGSGTVDGLPRFLSLSKGPLLTGLVAWGLLSLLVFVACWPAMWVEPLGTLDKMLAETSDYVEGHVNVNYFMGQPTFDPGLFFYPVAYLFRTTPIVLIGLIAAFVLAWPQRRRTRLPFDHPPTRHAAAGLLLFALVFTLAITVGAKKFDRYLLPAFLPLDVLAALGWVGLAKVIGLELGFIEKEGVSQPKDVRLDPTGEKPWWHSAMVGAFLFLLVLPAGLTYPYYFTYYNPLVGGTLTAPNALFVGWGEGLDEAAAWLNEQPDAEKLHVATWYADGPFSYFFRGQSAILNNVSPLRWLDSDFMIHYVNQWQRQKPSPEAVAWFSKHEPVHVVRANGLELARIYNVREAPLPDFLDWSDKRRADFAAGQRVRDSEYEGQIGFVGYHLEQTEAQAGDEFFVTLYERSLAPMEIDYSVLVRLVAADGRELWRNEGWPWGAPTSNWPVGTHRPDGHQIVIPEDAAPGLYALTLSFYDPASFDSLVVTQEGTNQPTGEAERVIDFIRIGPSVPPNSRADGNGDGGEQSHRALDPLPQLGSVARLNAVSLPEQLARGEVLSMGLEWESLEYTPLDYTVFVHIVAPDGTLAAQQDRLPLNGFAPTHLWDAGESFWDEYQIPLSAETPPAEYEVRIGLYTLEGGRLPVSLGASQAGDFVTVGRVLISE